MRRRPLFWAALCLCAGIFAVSFSAFTAVFAGIAVLGAAFFFFKEERAYALRLVLISFIAGAALFWNASRVPAGDASRFAGSEVSIGGVVDSETRLTPSPFGAPGASFDLAVGRVWPESKGRGEAASGRVRAYIRVPLDRLPAYGDEIVLRGRLELPHGRRNPGGFDSRAWLERKGVRSVLFADKAVPPRTLAHKKGNRIVALSLRTKAFLSEAVGRHFEGRDAALLRALFLGERGDFDGEFLDAFVKTGTLHILSVSGFNVGFLIFTVFFLLKPVPLPRDTVTEIALAAVWGYCLLVGWQAPVVRASVMATVFLIASVIGRKADGLNVLGFAAIAILVLRPYEFFDPGFRLSFLAVFALVALMPKFSVPAKFFPGEKPSALQRVGKYAGELWWVSFVCLFASLPLTVQSFYAVTPYAPLANLAVVPAAFLLFFMGALFFLLFAWLPAPLAFLPALMKPLMSALAAALFFLEDLPGAYIVTGSLHPALWAVLVAGLAALFALPTVSPRLRALAIVLFASCIFLAQEIVRHAPRPFSVTVLDVGQGDAVYVEFPRGGNMLVDAGSERSGDRGRRVVVPFLRERGVRSLDAVVVSHPQEDHIGGFEAVFDAMRVEAVLEGRRDYPSELYRRFEESVEKKGVRRLALSRGARVTGVKDAEILALHPVEGRPHGDVNDDSLVLRIASGGASVLLTGDLGEPGMRDLLASGSGDLAADALKAPHHGAKTGETGARFFAAVSPDVSVISCGERNPFRHPRPETLRSLEREGAVFRTDLEGAIVLTSEKDAFRAAPAVRG